MANTLNLMDLKSELERVKDYMLPVLCYFAGRRERSTEYEHLSAMVCKLHSADQLIDKAIRDIEEEEWQDD